MAVDTYKTIQAESNGLFKDRGSKFIAFGYPVTSEEEVKVRVQQLKKKYHDARHHCYAYRIGYRNQVYRINDDGEPSGTAGKPIYGQILSSDLTNVLIVVVRYFGGTLLGTSGLINAYRNAAKDCLNNSSIIVQAVMTKLLIHFQYEQMSVVMRIIKEENANITKQKLDLECDIELSIRESHLPALTHRLTLLNKVTITEMNL